MLDLFDWLRRARSGAELLATLRVAETSPELFLEPGKLGPPISLLEHSCDRCWIFEPIVESGYEYCRVCSPIIHRALKMGTMSRKTVVLWAHLNMLPIQIQDRIANKKNSRQQVMEIFIKDENHFLILLDRRQLKNWFQELIIYNAPRLAGLIQIVPTTGMTARGTMGDVLCRIIHHDSRFPMDALRVRFFSSPNQVYLPHRREQKGLLTFDIKEFMHLLDMAVVFRSMLGPKEQDMLKKLLGLEDLKQQRFYWGRFTGMLRPASRDMLNAWKIRQWPREKIQLLYEMTEYVTYVPY